MRVSSTSNHNDNDEDLLSKLHAMIDHQYAIIEDYCQTQTLVGNLLLTTKTVSSDGNSQRRRPDSNKLLQAVQQLRRCLQAVQQDTDSWNQLLLLVANTNLSPVLQQHVALSQRVLQTIHQPYHANGIPVSTNANTNSNRHETNTVALATLRASGARLKDALL